MSVGYAGGTVLFDGLGLEDLHPRQVIEGDIILDSYTRDVIGLDEEEEPADDLLLSDESRKKKGVNGIEARVWPGGVVPFVIGPFIGELKCHLVPPGKCVSNLHHF